RTIPQSIFARRILAAGKERTSFPRALLDKIASTAWLRALHTQCEWLGGLALRISGAGDELSKPPGLHHHRAAAFLALLIRRQLNLRNNFNGSIIELLKILCVLAGRLILVAGQAEEFPLRSPLISIHSPDFPQGITVRC